MPSDRIRDNGHKMRHRKLHLNTKRNFFTARVTECWDRLAREVAKSPSLEIFKTSLVTILRNVLQVTPFELGAWTK